MGRRHVIRDVDDDGVDHRVAVGVPGGVREGVGFRAGTGHAGDVGVVEGVGVGAVGMHHVAAQARAGGRAVGVGGHGLHARLQVEVAAVDVAAVARMRADDGNARFADIGFPIVRGQRRVVDVRQVDRQRGGREVAVAVPDGVDEGVARVLRDAVAGRHVAVAAVGVQRQHAMHTRDGRLHPAARRRRGVAIGRTHAHQAAAGGLAVGAEDVVAQHAVGRIHGQRGPFRHVARIHMGRRHVVHDGDRDVARCMAAACTVHRHRNGVDGVACRLVVGLRCVQRVAVGDGGRLVAICRVVARDVDGAAVGRGEGQRRGIAGTFQLSQCVCMPANGDLANAVGGTDGHRAGSRPGGACVVRNQTALVDRSRGVSGDGRRHRQHRSWGRRQPGRFQVRGFHRRPADIGIGQAQRRGDLQDAGKAHKGAAATTAAGQCCRGGVQVVERVLSLVDGRNQGIGRVVGRRGHGGLMGLGLGEEVLREDHILALADGQRGQAVGLQLYGAARGGDDIRIGSNAHAFAQGGERAVRITDPCLAEELGDEYGGGCHG